jgi:type IV secretory pathway TraG/TraD family ATPase VirD4
MLGQFATKFIFRTSEPQMARTISEMSGYVEYKEQQQNTSYGAHAHRDGISYTEPEKRKPLITIDDLASLPDLKCFAMLPDPRVRVARLKMGYKD